MTESMVMMMAVLAGELLLVLFVLLLVAWYRNRAARRRDNKAIRVLVTRIKNGRTERETGIARYLAEQVGLCGEPLEQAKAAILRAELVLLQRFAGVYKKRDAGSAAQFDIDLAAAVAPYHALQSDEIVVAADEPNADLSQLEQLREDNARLSEELRVTMETMSRMLNEYSSMFAGGAEGMAAPLAVMAGAAGSADGGADEFTDSGPQTELDAPLSDAGSSEGTDFELPVDDSDAEGGVLADAEIGELAVDEAAAEPGILDDIGDIADLSVEGDGNTEVLAEDLAGDDTDLTEQDAIDPLLMAGSVDSLLDESEPDVAVVSNEGPPDEVTDVLEEVLGDASAEFALEEEVPTGDTQTSSAELDQSEDAEISVDSEEIVVNDEALPGIEIEEGDDLETVTELLEEDGVAEVVAFDEPGEFGEPGDFEVALAVEDDQLFDSAESEIIARAEEAAGDLIDNGGNSEEPDVEGLFDAVEEPLTARTGP